MLQASGHHLLEILSMYLQWLRITTKHVIQDSRYPERNSNQTPPEYKSRALPVDQPARAEVLLSCNVCNTLCIMYVTYMYSIWILSIIYIRSTTSNFLILRQFMRLNICRTIFPEWKEIHFQYKKKSLSRFYAFWFSFLLWQFTYSSLVFLPPYCSFLTTSRLYTQRPLENWIEGPISNYY
jgi:hypothetical protein